MRDLIKESQVQKLAVKEKAHLPQSPSPGLQGEV